MIVRFQAITVDLMDVSATDVLIGILLVNLGICAAYALRTVRRRRAVVVAVKRERARLGSLPPKPRRKPATEPATTTEPDTEAAAKDEPGAVVPQQLGRHREIEELMRAATYRLSPDRLARAKVPGATLED